MRFKGPSQTTAFSLTRSKWVQKVSVGLVGSNSSTGMLERIFFDGDEIKPFGFSGSQIKKKLVRSRVLSANIAYNERAFSWLVII